MEAEEDYRTESEIKYPKLAQYLADIQRHKDHSDYLEDIVDLVLRENAHSEHVGYRHDRCKQNPREQAFYEQWVKVNEPIHGLNAGHGILQDLFFERDERALSSRHGKFVELMNERDRMIVATVIQWLGSNIGMCFLEEALNKFGETIKRK